MIVPLYGFVEGDTMGLLVLANPETTVTEIIARLNDGARPRVDPRGTWRLMARGRDLMARSTVGELELDAFERLDLRRGRGR